METLRCPALYQINTRVSLTELSRGLGRAATLDDIPDAALDELAALGFDWIWMLSVWQTGLAAQQVSRGNHEWRQEYQATLPDLREEDIPGSGFAITGYVVHQALGGDAALARLRERLRKRGLRLMLDFVPNHTGLDHPWVEDHPEYYVAGTEIDLARAPQNYTWARRKRGDLLLAYGRDPYFAGWPDTLQLNYGNPATQEAMAGELVKIAGQCDGVRCDMAMLVLPDIFERTWGMQAEPFWPRTIRRVRERAPGFCFMAEVYWDLEWTLQQQGSITPTTSACTTACATGTPGRFGSTSGRGSTTRKRWPASWRTMTNPRGGDVPSGGSRGRGGDHLSVPGAAVLPPGAVPGAHETDFTASRKGSGRADQPGTGQVLRPAPPRAAAPGCSPG